MKELIPPVVDLDRVHKTEADVHLDTTYHRKHEYGLPVTTFVNVWLKDHCPKLDILWRERSGGWVRWLFFTASDGLVHGLNLPSYWKERTEVERRALDLVHRHWRESQH